MQLVSLLRTKANRWLMFVLYGNPCIFVIYNWEMVVHLGVKNELHCKLTYLHMFADMSCIYEICNNAFENEHHTRVQ